MRLVVTSEARFSVAHDGSLWTKSPYDYGFWRRYLSVFERMRVVARAATDPEIDASFKRVTGAGVEFVSLPFYLGPKQFFLKRQSLRFALENALEESDALICRVGSPIAGLLLPALRAAGRPYGLEVVGDPNQALAPGTVQHPLRPLFRWLGTRALQREVEGAAGVAYVTRDSLQKKYQAAGGSFSTNYSSISLAADDFVSEPRVYRQPETARLVFVGSLAQMYKGADVLLKAVQKLVQTYDVHLTMIGDGKHRIDLEDLARSLSIEKHIRFLGELPSGRSVRDELDRASLFVLPSRSEGLPRAMIEAMARALPCIGTNVGGIPELLREDEMVAADDPSALAMKLQQVLDSPETMTQMSARNLHRAQEYRPELLAKRRDEFYGFLRNATEQWIAGQRRTTAEPVLQERISA